MREKILELKLVGNFVVFGGRDQLGGGIVRMRGGWEVACVYERSERERNVWVCVRVS